ncbi:MAG: outer membrane lipoprotein-sorting protein [Limisphaerales bacterium]
MKTQYTVAVLFFSLFTCGVYGARDSAPSTDQLAEGQRLVRQIQVARPEHDSEIRGVLNISHDGKKHVPVTCKIIVRGDTWQTIYESKPIGGIPAELLIITRTAGGANQYAYARAATVDSPIPQPRSIPTQQAYVPFAQSDFWLTDLGTEFIFWPEQARLKGELRLGRDCYLLESINPNAREIVRIKAFVDKETNGILVAEGYDARNKLVKEFSLHGSSFKKVNGQWRLEKMDMHNAKTGSQTVLKFDLPKE